MPTYFYNMYDQETGEGDPFAWDKAARQIDYFKANKQLNCDALYQTNSHTGGESMFSLNEDIIDTKTLTGNLLATTKIDPNITLNAGASFQRIGTENFQQINDLLGGQYFLNKSYYSGENYDTPENLRIGEGDKYQYHYKALVQRANVFGQLRFKFRLYIAKGCFLSHFQLYIQRSFRLLWEYIAAEVAPILHQIIILDRFG